MNLSERYGLIRSWLMYYGKPFNRKKLIRFYSQFISAGDLVFDIGAHLGNRTDAFLALGAQVIAVEPQPNCIQFLTKKFNTGDQLTVLPQLVSNDIQECDFYINTFSPTISTARNVVWQNNINSYSFVKPRWDKKQKVNSITLDYMIQIYGLPVFCKIDTEGYEFEVLSGLSHAIRYISIEYLAFDHERILGCLDKIASLGEYLVNFSPGESQKWLWQKWRSSEEVKVILSKNKLDCRFGDFYFKLK